eukprot:3186901-Rhodomonas_salina.4
MIVIISKGITQKSKAPPDCPPSARGAGCTTARASVAPVMPVTLMLRSVPTMAGALRHGGGQSALGGALVLAAPRRHACTSAPPLAMP